MKPTHLLIALIYITALTACAAKPEQAALTKPETAAMTEPQNLKSTPSSISTSGTVRFQEMEGGFWGIIADDGRKFDPMGLDKKFQKDGLRVRFDAEPDTDRMSTHMWGTIITVVRIEVVK